MNKSKQISSANDSALSSFQRGVVKELEKLCSPFIPYRIVKSHGTNHLKLFIDQCDVIGVSSTPSDFRAKKQVISDIKRQLSFRKEKIEGIENNENHDDLLPSPSEVLAYGSNRTDFSLKAMDDAKKYITKNIDKIKTQELKIVSDEQSINNIDSFRKAKAEEIISHVVSFIKEYNPEDKELNLLLTTCVNHLRFHLPTKKEYSEKFELSSNHQAVKEGKQTQNLDVEHTLVVDEKEDECSELDLIKGLLGTKSKDRINLFKTLNDNDAEQIIDDIKEALARNRKGRISKIAALMKEGNITLLEIENVLNAQKK